MDKDLQLSLIKKWFEMTKSGEKKEDYREITPYWCNRLLLANGEIMSKEKWRVFLLENGINYLNYCFGDTITSKNFDNNIMTLGYPKKGDHERTLIIEHQGIKVRDGNPEWGAEPNKLYFVIKHGAIDDFERLSNLF